VGFCDGIDARAALGSAASYPTTPPLGLPHVSIRKFWCHHYRDEPVTL
jgi:hypothetical protein